ncbi:HXXEE domain-containing protein [Lactiplantibacillus herbarum]|uniref:HXXEE domain-containing protein n=1 Tax=Lactiplantibacillus herbarum TaxID=1670446 RepID=UPI00064F762A|nr:HXXEE domain-containing protein [Lactiplantibacillus herbarum]
MKKFLDKFTQLHVYIDIISFILVTTLLLIRWSTLTNYARLAYALMSVMCLHQLEEYRFPGGFLWGFNKILGAKDPIRYPGNRLSASTVDIISFILTIPPLLMGCSPRLAAIFAIFALIEAVLHTYFGFSMLVKFHQLGKDTIYFPGNATAWFLFTPLALALVNELVGNHLLSATGWLQAIGMILAFMVVVMAVLTLTLKDPHSPYIYRTEPREGYFKKYIK